MTNPAPMKSLRRNKSQTHCLQDAEASSKDFPDTAKTALFAFKPETLEKNEREELERLFESSAVYRRVVEGMRDDRKWLAPQYGMQ